jgi:hypothetical protein
MKINKENLTILFQGKFDQSSVDNIKRTISNIASSHVIVSCWEGDLKNVDISGLSDVKFIMTDDPGVNEVIGYKIDNINRQILSSKRGLEYVKTDYVLKLRTDSYLDNSFLIQRGNELLGACKRHSNIFSEKVIVTNLTTLDAFKTGHCFHVCDWIFMGRLVDVKEIFSLDLKEKDYFSFFSSNRMPVSEICSQHRAETALIEHVVREKGFGINCNNTEDVEDSDKIMSCRVLYNDFVILNPWTIGLRSTKHRLLYFWVDRDRVLESQWKVKNNIKVSFYSCMRERVYLSINALIKILVKLKILLYKI